MRRLIVGLLGLSALSVGAASAADLPAKAPVYKAAPVALYNWTGFYVGAHAGYGWGRASWGDVQALDTTLFDDTLDGEGPSQRLRGALAGGQIGYQQQWNSMVFGIEASGSWADLKQTTNSTFGAADDVYTTKIKSILQVVGRLGIASGTWHPYVKGGYAGGNVELSISDAVPVTGSASSKVWTNGFVLGAGVEYAVARNWIVGLDYSYIQLQAKRHSMTTSEASSLVYDVSRIPINVVTGRISYRFGP